MRYTWMLPCAVLGGVLMAACQVLIYRYAPVEQTMGLVQKIFYTHLPLAWWSFVSFFLVCVSGVAYLKTRNRHWDARGRGRRRSGRGAQRAGARFRLHLGAPFVGRLVDVGPAPDHDDDPLVPLCGYLVLRKMDMPRERQANLCAVVGIVAFVDVPLVFLSARLWRSTIPPCSPTSPGGLNPK